MTLYRLHDIDFKFKSVGHTLENKHDWKIRQQNCLKLHTYVNIKIKEKVTDQMQVA